MEGLEAGLRPVAATLTTIYLENNPAVSEGPGRVAPVSTRRQGAWAGGTVS